MSLFEITFWDRISFLPSRIKDKWRYLKCCLFNPHNILKIESLPPTWCDTIEKIVHVNFQLLVDFMEKEEPFKYINWEFTPEHSAAAREMRELYYWWKHVRSFRHDPLEDVDAPDWRFEPVEDMPGYSRMIHDENDPKEKPWQEACKKSEEMRQLWDEEDDDMMIRLIKLRKWLWT